MHTNNRGQAYTTPGRGRPMGGTGTPRTSSANHRTTAGTRSPPGTGFSPRPVAQGSPTAASPASAYRPSGVSSTPRDRYGAQFDQQRDSATRRAMSARAHPGAHGAFHQNAGALASPADSPQFAGGVYHGGYAHSPPTPQQYGPYHGAAAPGGQYHHHYAQGHHQGSPRPASHAGAPLRANPHQQQQQQPQRHGQYQRRSPSSDVRAYADPYAQPAALSAAARRSPSVRHRSPSPTSSTKHLEGQVFTETVDGYPSRRFLCRKRLGSGGFANVYKIADEATGEEFAAKVIDKRSLKKPDQLEKLHREIEIQQRLDHPNVLRIHGHFEEANKMFILLDVCSNHSLLEFVNHRRDVDRKRLPVTLEESQYIMLQLLLGLQHLHDRRVIHRDLKLGNVLVDDQLRIKIADFGLAAALTQEGELKLTCCGTPNYIPPEVLELRHHKKHAATSARFNTNRAGGGSVGYDHRADLWSLGVMLYTFFTGTPPFETSDLESTYAQIQRGAYDVPSHIPRSAVDLIRWLLQIRPADRPSLVEMRQHPFFEGCSATDKPPQTLIDYFARAGGIRTSELEERIQALAVAPSPSPPQEHYRVDDHNAHARPSVAAEAEPRAGDVQARTALAAADHTPARNPSRQLFTRGLQPLQTENLAPEPATGVPEPTPRGPPSAGLSPVGLASPTLPFPPGLAAPPRDPTSMPPATSGAADFVVALKEKMMPLQLAGGLGNSSALVPMRPLADAACPRLRVVVEQEALPRYGCAYRTEGDLIGAIFNDRTRIASLASGFTKYYDKPASIADGPATEQFHLDGCDSPTAGIENVKKAKLCRFFIDQFASRFQGTVEHIEENGAPTHSGVDLDALPPVASAAEADAVWEGIVARNSGPPLLSCVPGIGAMLAAGRMPASISQLLPPLKSQLPPTELQVRRMLAVAVLDTELAKMHRSEASRKKLLRFSNAPELRQAIETVVRLMTLTQLSNGTVQVSFFASEYALAQNMSPDDLRKQKEKNPDAEVLFDARRRFPPLVAAVATVVIDESADTFSLLLAAQQSTDTASTRRYACTRTSYECKEAFCLLRTAMTAAPPLAMHTDVDASASGAEVVDMSDGSPADGLQGADVGASLAAALWLHRAYSALGIAASSSGSPSAIGTLRLATKPAVDGSPMAC